MKGKTHNITGVFKNIPGKGIDEPAIAKKTWYSTNIQSKDFICTQETKCKTKEQACEWFPLSWHGIYNAH